jgi:hypothetical protein
MLCPLLFQEHERIKARKPAAGKVERSSKKVHVQPRQGLGKLAEMAAMPEPDSSPQRFHVEWRNRSQQVPAYA